MRKPVIFILIIMVVLIIWQLIPRPENPTALPSPHESPLVTDETSPVDTPAAPAKEKGKAKASTASKRSSARSQAKHKTDDETAESVDPGLPFAEGAEMPEFPDIVCQILDGENQEPIPFAKAIYLQSDLAISHHTADENGILKVPVRSQNPMYSVYAKGYTPREAALDLDILKDIDGIQKIYLSPNRNTFPVRVSDPDGRPIAEVALHQYPLLRNEAVANINPDAPLEDFEQKIFFSQTYDPQKLSVTMTNEEGMAELERHGYPLQTLILTREGFQTKLYTLEHKEMDNAREFIMEPQHAYRGRLLDQNRNPLPDVLVQYRKPFPPTIEKTTTDVDGMYTVYTDSQSLLISYSRVGYTLAHKKEKLKSDGDLVDTILSEGPAQPIQIRDSQGKPVDRVAVFSAGNERWLKSARKGLAFVYSDALGRTMVPGSNGQRVHLLLKKWGYPWQSFIIEANGTTVDLSYDPLSSLSGYVYSENGKPLANAEIYAQPSPRDPEATSYTNGSMNALLTLSGTDGSFHFQKFPTGPVGVMAKRTNFVSTKTKVNIQPGHTIDDLRLIMKPSVRLEGQVFDTAGNALRNVYIIAISEHGQKETATTNQEGKYLLHSLPAGLVTIRGKKAKNGDVAFENNEIVSQLFPGSNQIDLVLQIKSE